MVCRFAAALTLVLTCVLLPVGTPMVPAAILAASPPALFYGSCYSFRGDGWGIAQRLASLQSYWWQMLQADYSGNYPPSTGGSVPGITDAQYQHAAVHMRQVEKWVGDTKVTGSPGSVSRRITSLTAAHGMKGPDSSSYGWAIRQLSATMHDLYAASQAEAAATGTGLASYHRSQNELTYSWQALKQLPCTAFPFTAPAWLVQKALLYSQVDWQGNVTGSPSTSFSGAVGTIYTDIEIGASTSSHTVDLQWIAPDGSVYQNELQSNAPPHGAGYEIYLQITNTRAGATPGRWSLRILLDGYTVKSVPFTIYG